MKFILYLLVDIMALVLAFPLVPVAVLLSDKEGRLPKPLRWLETFDALGWSGPLSEPTVKKTYDRWGPKAGLIHWLWRNKNYTLKYWMRAKVPVGTVGKERGVYTPARWGYSSWSAQMGPYWEWRPCFGIGFVHFYLRVGWKLFPYFLGTPEPTAGIFQGISIRMDDWDDFKEE